MLSFYNIKKDVLEKWSIAIDLTFTTKVDNTIYGFANGDNNIFVNANKFITEDKILGVIGHELAHLLSKSSSHDSNFDSCVYSVIDFFKEKYFVDISHSMDILEIK
jgi:Zn-dependent peptidase ImmA (M78 family)